VRARARNERAQLNCLSTLTVSRRRARFTRGHFCIALSSALEIFFLVSPSTAALEEAYAYYHGERTRESARELRAHIRHFSTARLLTSRPTLTCVFSFSHETSSDTLLLVRC